MNGKCFVISIIGGVVLLWTTAAVQTFTVMPTPPGQFVAVNNGPGDQAVAHVDGDLVCYEDSSTGNVYVRYYNLLTHTDNAVPAAADGSADFECDIRGTTIVFTRSAADNAIFSFDTSTLQLTELAPRANSQRFGAQIGDETIVWIDFPPGIDASAITAYDRATGTITELAPLSAFNTDPGISPDGTVVVWKKCPTPSTSCDIWSAVRGGTTWTTHQITNASGNCSHPDTNGQVVVYSCDRGAGDHLYWQVVTGGVEHDPGLFGQQINPSVAGSFVSFAGTPIPGGNSDIYVLDLSTSAMFQITNTVANETLNDISIGPDGKVHVVWQVLETDWNVYAFTFGVSTEALLTNLVNLVNSFDLSHGITTSLDAKLQAAEAALAAKRANDLTTACNDMTAFINAVSAQSGNMLTVDQASQLIAAAQQIKAALGCP